MIKKNVKIIYLLFNIALIAVIAILDPYLEGIGDIAFKIKFSWLIIAILSIMMVWLLDAIIFRYTIGLMYGAIQFTRYLKISVMGKYFNAITPFASGGAPWQLNYMVKSGIPSGYASSSLMMKYWIYQGVLTIYASIAFIYRGSHIRQHSRLLYFAAIIGIVLNAAGPLMLYFLSTNKGAIKKIADFVISFLCKLRLIKDFEKAQNRLLVSINDFHNSIKHIKGNFKALFFIVFITVAEITFYLSIPYFIYRGQGLIEVNWIDMVLTHLFLYLAISFFPTPGSSGVSEGGFYLLFSLFFPQKILFVSMLLWRLISYYLMILGGGTIILLDNTNRMTKPLWQRLNKRKKKVLLNDYKSS